MEDRKLPWWRRALNIALDGIRSGFGLFSKPHKEEPADEPEFVAAHEETPEKETEMNGDPAASEIFEEAATSEETFSVHEPAVEALAKPVMEPIAARISEPIVEVIEEPAEESLPEFEAPQLSPEEVVPEQDATLPEEMVVHDSEEQAVEAQTESTGSLLAEEATEPEQVPVEDPIHSEVELESAEASVPAALPATNESTQPSFSEALEAALVTAPLAAPQEPEEEIAAVAETPEETVSKPEVHTEREPEVAAIEETEIPPGIEGEAAAAVDVRAATRESEIESLPEPTLDEEPTQAEESISEEPVSSVELSEPILAEVAEGIPGQPDTAGNESQEEGPFEAEPVPQPEPAAELAAEHAAEQVAEETVEPFDNPMELNEPIPEQPDAPTEAGEAMPVAEAAAESIATEETTVQPTTSELMAAEATAELADEAGPTAAATPAAPSKPFIKLESRDNESDLSPFSVVVSQVYDGPLDLLLDLIRKQDIDIYDIPIARITAQFLAYVNQLKATDVDVAGEFIYTASLLIHIKSKMLLPRAPSGGDDAAEDPRRELVERLLEHERFKNAAQMLQQKQMLEAATWTNPGMREFQDDTSAEPEIAADTVDLVRIFRDILERARNRPVINVEEDSVTVGQMIQFLARRLTMEDKPVALRRLLSQTRSERALIAMFLALLELVRLQAILLRQDRLFSEIFIKKHVGFESVMNEGAASVHDDWR